MCMTELSTLPTSILPQEMQAGGTEFRLLDIPESRRFW